MNRETFPEMLQCVNPSGAYCPDMTVLERQHACLKWQHQQQGIYEDFFSSGLNGGGAFCMTSQGLIVTDMANNNPVQLDPGVYKEWPDLGGFGGNCGLGGDIGLLEANYGMSLKASGRHPSASLAPVAVMAYQKSGQVGKESFRKRKVDPLSIIKTEDENEEEKIKGLSTEETGSKHTVQSNNNNNNDCKKNKKEANSGSNSKENVRNSEVQKQDYIHVRARRGQATDSHSLAERVRREKISERMKFLQDLVPGCNKITGKAGMLDEIINYVQSLQRQVEFLSMKLATVSPRLDIDIESLFAKEISPACTPSFAMIEAGSSELTNQGYLHFNPASPVASCVGMELGVNPDPGLWRTISAPLPATEKFHEAQSFAQMQAQSATTWDDTSLQNLYNIEFQQGRAMPFPGHQITGSLEAGNMKLEM